VSQGYAAPTTASAWRPATEPLVCLAPRYAEGFIACARDALLLPLQERTLQWSRDSDHQIMARYSHLERFD